MISLTFLNSFEDWNTEIKNALFYVELAQIVPEIDVSGAKYTPWVIISMWMQFFGCSRLSLDDWCVFCVGGLHFRFNKCRSIIFESKLLINYYGMVKTIQNLAVHYFVNFNQRVHWKSLIIHTVKDRTLIKLW